MVGDQIDRDIRPAQQAGFKTILFPGAFRPIWEIQSGNVMPDFAVDTFLAVPGFVAQTINVMTEDLLRDHNK